MGDPLAELPGLFECPLGHARGDGKALGQLPVGETTKDGDEQAREGGGDGLVDPHMRGQHLLDALAVWP
ncbi:MAG: hypothetical protein AUG00_08515 [Candidatus Rokubacteria bacterium 13_1_20CM_2_70_7]|nr:MAG: hypothetical protein AUG00_08515 [Candidatus Rokubacteria bacterium 13_1_20CM_2_70_7]